VGEDSTLSPALNDVFLPFRESGLANAVCITPPVAPAAPAAVAIAPRAPTLSKARETYWQQLLATAREQKDESVRRAVTREAVQGITVQRQEEIQKQGYFVTNRRPH
jgi:hypothetical protein